MTTLTLRSRRTASVLHHNSRGLLKTQLHCSSSFQSRYHQAERRLASSATNTNTNTNINTNTNTNTKPNKPTSKIPRSTTTAVPSKSPSTINGPSSTLPASLFLPVREPNQAFFPTYALKLGKAYANFYKTGVKNIYYNFRASRPIQQRIDNKFSGSIANAISANAFTRSDFQLLYRNWHDVKRVPAFALVFLVCGEFTPLVVIAISNIVPWTCRIPKQIASDRKKIEERRAISFRNLTAAPPVKPGVIALERQQLIHISWSLGLSSAIWDWLGGQYPGLPTFLLRRKVERRVKYLDMDDLLIEKAGGVARMDAEEVSMGLVERGVDILGKPEQQLRAAFNSWLKSREKVPVERLLLTRPSVWPVKTTPKPAL